MGTLEQQNALLRQTFHFSAHDLEYNRAGQLSPGQDVAPPQDAGGSCLTWFGLLFSGGMTAVLLIALVSGLREGVEGAGGICVGLLLFGIPAGMIGWGLLENWSNTQQDRSSPYVMAATGLAQLVPSENGATLKIGGVSFWLNGDKASVFKPLEAYHVYYLSNSRRIVAAECVPGP